MTGRATGNESALDAAANGARAARDRTLAIAFVTGIIGVSSSVLLGYSVFGLPFVALAAFASWGMVDHFARRNILRYSSNTRMLLRRMKQLIAAIGVIAVLTFAFLFFGSVLGVIIS